MKKKLFFITPQSGAGAMPRTRVSNVSRAGYKAYSFSESRKFVTVDGKRLGYLEYLVLEFSSKHHLIQAAQVREYLKQEHGINIDLRRIHDSLQRLLRKGIIEKLSRGVYKLTSYGKKLLSSLLASKRGKESESKATVNGVCSRVASDGRMFADGGGIGFTRARLHALNARSLEDLVKQLYALYRVTACALNYLKQFLGKKRFYRVVGGVGVACVDSFVGGHGTNVLGKSKSLRRPLISLEYFYSLGIKPREVGIDVYTVIVGIDKLSVKAYFG